MKTPMQEFIDWLNSEECKAMMYDHAEAISIKANSLLKYEESVIRGAYYEGRYLYNNHDSSSEKYYNETFNIK